MVCDDGYDDYEGCVELENRSIKLSYTLECNTAKSRTPFGTIAAGESVRTIIPKLWPGMLKNATRPFGRYNSRGNNGRDIYDALDKYSIDKSWHETRHEKDTHDYAEYAEYAEPFIGETDAIYQFLQDGMESFLEVLLDRNSNKFV